MTVRVGLIGAGGIARQNHIPGFALLSNAKVTALCDSDPHTLELASKQSGVSNLFSDHRELLRSGVADAVVIATPNVLHHPIALDAIAAGKHVLCEKPLAMSYAQALEMADCAERAGVRHMTAFTYRFVPGMRYLKHLADEGAIGEIYHFRAARLQEFGPGSLGWRQVRAQAGSGELGDMLSHRIDFGHHLVGNIDRLVAQARQFLAEREGRDRSRHVAEVEDWVAVLADFRSGVTGVLESSKLATGHGFGGESHDRCELNGSEGTLIYQLNRPLEILRGGRNGHGLAVEPVPESFLKVNGSPRSLDGQDPVQSFRFDQDFEFIDAIVNQRTCVPSFYDGARVQSVIDAVLLSVEQQRWVSIEEIERSAQQGAQG